MTDGGKPHRDAEIGLSSAPSGFAPLTPIIAPHETELRDGMRKLSSALSGFDQRVHLSIEVLDGSDRHEWGLETGLGKGAAYKRASKKPDIRLVMRRETWERITQGAFNPFDAFATGKLLVGGDTELAKRVVQHLSDPRIPFVSPC